VKTLRTSGIPAVLVILLLGALAGLVLLVGEYGVAQEQPVRSVESPLLTSNREDYSLCVDAAPSGSVSAADQEAVTRALSALRQELADRSYEQTVLSRLDGALVTSGCPPAAAVSGHHYVDPDTGRRRVAGGRTSNPSEHVLHIYVVAQDTFQSWFGNQSYGTSTEEAYCTGHQCIPATHGLYIKPGMGQAVLHEALRDVLGFVDPFQRFGLPTPGVTPDTANP